MVSGGVATVAAAARTAAAAAVTWGAGSEDIDLVVVDFADFEGLGGLEEGAGVGVDEGTTAGTAVEGAARIIAGVEGEQRGGSRRREVGMHDGAWINNILNGRRGRGKTGRERANEQVGVVGDGPD